MLFSDRLALIHKHDNECGLRLSNTCFGNMKVAGRTLLRNAAIALNISSASFLSQVLSNIFFTYSGVFAIPCVKEEKKKPSILVSLPPGK